MNAPISSPSHHQSAAAYGSSTHQSPNQIVPPPPSQRKTPSTDIFLKELNLVAEAAKRAQVAVMMRDFEACAL